MPQDKDRAGATTGTFRARVQHCPVRVAAYSNGSYGMRTKSALPGREPTTTPCKSTVSTIAAELAYLVARQPAEAVGEFQRILDHRSIVLVHPMGAMARLQLARALVLSGDTVKAKSAYHDLLTLWTNADPELPVLKEARAEYARLP